MEVLTAEHMGFCYGVRRAVEMAAAAPGQTGAPVFTLGPLIHNPQMIERLKAQGIGVHFKNDESGIEARRKIEGLLGGVMQSTRPTHTL